MANYNDRPTSYKPVKKNLPYTITPIADNDVLKWRLQEAAKQSEWDAGKAERYAVSKERALSVLNIGTQKPDPEALMWERFKADQAKQQELFEKIVQKPPICSSKNSCNLPKLSLKDRILNWFTNLKF